MDGYGSYSRWSDRRHKEDIETILDPLRKVKSLRGVTFKWKDSGQHSLGLIAQEVEGIINECVTTDTNGFKLISYSPLIGLLIEAIKELAKRVDELDSK